MIAKSTVGAGLPGSKPRILVVDDLPQNRELLVRYLRHRGCEALEAEGGRAALAMIEESPFDVVLLDLMMPDVDGMEVLRRVRERRSLADLPVIMITARTESEDVIAALAAEASDYIAKPVDFDVLFARVDTQVRRKRAEASIRLANDDLERQLAELRRERAEGPDRNFLADMGHELRTPLNGVIGVAEALAGTDLQPRQQELVKIIESSAATLERLLADLLEQGRANAGRLEIKGETFDLGDAVLSVAALWRARAQEKGIGFEVLFPREAEGDVHGDPIRLKQILTNLLSNAVKFTSRGFVRLTVAREEEVHRFTVLDSGIGFDAEAAERIFARFEQADGSISSRFGGTGLGLAISRDLAQLMGGSLRAESAQGEGATFALEVPLLTIASRAGGRSTAGHPSRLEAQARPLRVLYADDHPVNRQVVKLIFETAPGQVSLTCVEDGREAVAAFRSGEFDLILMDVQMPVMDGLTATRMIREFEAADGAPPIPILMLTAHNLAYHLRASAEAGADGHLSKPVNGPQLLEMIANHGLAGRSSASRIQVRLTAS